MFYDRLRGICKSNGTSITAFAAENGINPSTPNGWKNGRAPSADAVCKAAIRFKVTSDYLLGLTDQPYPETDFPIDERELLDAYRAADPVLRSAAMAVLKSSSGSPALSESAGLSPSRSADAMEAF